MKLVQLQEAFFNALLGEDNTFSEYVVDQGGIDTAQRVNIYRNAYVVRLRETLETDHEILGFYLGDELFEQMAQGYIASHPSHYRSLRHFANELPAFLESAEPFKQYPIVAELARFERAMLAAFDASEADRASLAQLQAIDPQAWPTLKISLHPSTRLFSTPWNCVESWQALKASGTPPEASAVQSYWCLWRNAERLTEFSSMSANEFRFATLAQSGQDFASSCDALADAMPQDQVSQFAVTTLVTWLERGIIAELAVAG